MGLIREVRINTVGSVLQTIAFEQQRPRFCEVAIFSNLTDPLIITSVDGTLEIPHFVGSPIVAGGDNQHFGGPVTGPSVRIDWQPTVNAKRAVFRFYEDWQPAFGRVLLRSWTEAGIAAAATSALVTVNSWGSWVRRVLLWDHGTQNRLLRAALIGGFLPGNTEQVDSPVAGYARVDFGTAVESMNFEAVNNGAVAMTWSGALYAELG